MLAQPVEPTRLLALLRSLLDPKARRCAPPALAGGTKSTGTTHTPDARCITLNPKEIVNRKTVLDRTTQEAPAGRARAQRSMHVGDQPNRPDQAAEPPVPAHASRWPAYQGRKTRQPA
jgi:hypothetical protein